MTTQMKRYIELSDVLTLKLDCKACGSVLQVPLSRNMSAPEERLKLDRCPMCLAEWASLNGSTYQPSIAKFSSALKELARIMESEVLGFDLWIEISAKDASVDEPLTSRS